jgi:hypothetical protein
VETVWLRTLYVLFFIELSTRRVGALQEETDREPAILLDEAARTSVSRVCEPLTLTGSARTYLLRLAWTRRT